MKLRTRDRILVGLAGLILIGICVLLIAQVFFQTDIIGRVGAFLSSESTGLRILTAAGALLLLALGGYCVALLVWRRTGNGQFITQKTEGGELSISMDALRTMVNKCLEQHPEILCRSVQLETQRDGLLVIISGTLAGGISIPLTVDTIQKQIKQYVTACSGVEVRSIQVRIEASGEDATDALFAIETPVAQPLLRGTDQEPAAELPPEDVPLDPELEELLGEKYDFGEKEKRENEETPPPVEVPAAAVAAAASLKSAAPEEEDDRPFHQRMFATQEEPCVMPMPPEPSEDVEDHS